MGRFIDISFPLNDGMAIYPGNPGFLLMRHQDMELGGGANVSEIYIGSHTGTHIDAPLHVFPDGEDIAGIDLSALNGSVTVLEIKENQITLEEISKHDIMCGVRIIFKTGNTDMFKGENFLEDYVTLDYEAAQYLADKRMPLIGIDYLTIEPPKFRREQYKSVHTTLLGAGVLILEGLNLSKVEPGIYELMCLPLKLEGCDGSPVRAVLIQLSEN